MEENTLINPMELYENYGKTPASEIQNLLKDIMILYIAHKGMGTIYGYYNLNEEKIKEIALKPRSAYLEEINSKNYSINSSDLGNLITEGLQEYKTIYFLTKESYVNWPREINRINIGEVFDQMSDDDKKITKAIYADFKGVCVIESPEIIDGRRERCAAYKAILFK